jgi:MinD superfamily P-loop ATPase
MKQLTIISGKGGTGKTSITSAFASLAKNAVFADCDVDAADLHLIFKPDILESNDFYGLKIPQIDNDKCTHCKKCVEYCKFNAIDDDININKESCEGCSVCEFVCSENAIEMTDRNSGFTYISDSRFGPFVHASLNTAEEASGKLVTVVRNYARDIAEKEKKELIIIDGPPGIGCPVISSISGVDLVLIVTEPTLSAIHDLERILGVTDHFKVPAIVCINKCDINLDNTKKIEYYCKNKNIDIVGKLSYDNIVTEAMIHEKTVVEYSKSNFSDKIIDMWNNIKRRLKE